jgi:hypothetical protein
MHSVVNKAFLSGNLRIHCERSSLWRRDQRQRPRRGPVNVKRRIGERRAPPTSGRRVGMVLGLHLVIIREQQQPKRVNDQLRVHARENIRKPLGARGLATGNAGAEPLVQR